MSAMVDAFGDALFGARKAAGLTQAELAEAVGVSRTVITMYETCRSAPSLDVALRLRHVLPALDLNRLGDDGTSAA